MTPTGNFGPGATAAAAAASGRQAAPWLSPELLRQLDVQGPRYTSYPTADRFIEAFSSAQHARALHTRALGAARNAGVSPLSVYVHIPFCESVCYYCACNKIITRQHDRAGPYLQALQTEIDMHVQALGRRQPLTQLHLGGGSPTFLSNAELATLMQSLRGAFDFADNAELAIEVDPRTADPQRLRHLAALGFNRLSLGVQDFDADVQKAVHRQQSLDSVAALLQAARMLDFRSTNVDLIYGLPRQTVASFGRTVAQVVALRPDRVALYAYAHLPQRFKPQRRIDAALLPAAADRITLLCNAIAALRDAGYIYIGMDHFALPGDALAVARRQGRLHRNFQGYSTQPDCDLIGLGVSAISRIGSSYSQNAKTLQEYRDLLAHGQFPVVRGLDLTRDDLLRRAVIMALMCQGRVELESIALAHLVDFGKVFGPELQALRALQDSGLVLLEPDAIEVTPVGWYFVRNVAMVFDRHLQADRTRSQFSRVF